MTLEQLRVVDQWKDTAERNLEKAEAEMKKAYWDFVKAQNAVKEAKRNLDAVMLYYK